jgi:hypothetical protein
MKWPKKLKQPMYVRTASRVRYMGKNYIVQRDISGAIYRLVGRMTRKLPSMEEAIAATENQKMVCQWGGYYSVYVQMKLLLFWSIYGRKIKSAAFNHPIVRKDRSFQMRDSGITVS